MYHFANSFILVLIVSILLTNKKSVVKFKIKEYLSTLKEIDKQVLIPYLKGAFILGMLIPILFWAVDLITTPLLDKVLHSPFKQTKSYEYIGFCYVDNKCRSMLLNNPDETSKNVDVLAVKIRSYMLNNMKSDHKHEK